MAGSFAEACAIIASVKPGGIGAMATAFRNLGAASVKGGDLLAGSAEQVGAQHGAPYAAYENRLAPVATWMRNLNRPTTSTATSLENARTVAQQAQWVMAQMQAALARYGASLGAMEPSAAAGAMAAAEAQALARLNEEIAKMTAAFAAVQPGDPGTAPVRGGKSGTATRTDPTGTGTGTGKATTLPAGTTTGGTTTGGTTTGGTTTGDTTTGDTTTDGAIGTDPTGLKTVFPGETETTTAADRKTGPFSGWVQDPTSGNLVDPATGREVEPGGRFVDPVTGQPFGDPSQYASRLEGLQGGVSASLGAPFGGVGVAPTFSGAGGGGGSAGFAPFYGGMIPPSLVGSNPASAQLRNRAAQNLALRAETAQRYNAIASGHPEAVPAPGAGGQPAAAAAAGHGYAPPMGGGMAPMGGAGAGAGGRTGRRGKRMVSEPGSVWGATGRGSRAKPGTEPATGTDVVEDADVWTGGPAVPGSGILGGR